MAAETHVDRSNTGPVAFVASDVVVTYPLLQAAYRLLQAFSIDEVIGNLGDGTPT